MACLGIIVGELWWSVRPD